MNYLDKLIYDKIRLIEEMNTQNNRQVGGAHYTKLEIQPWQVMQSWMTHEQFAGFLRGNVIKYMARYEHKGGIDDLRKAEHYLQKLIEIYNGNI